MVRVVTRAAPQAALAFMLAGCPPIEPARDAGLERREDAAELDAGRLDAAAIDASTVDAESIDAASIDASTVDAALLPYACPAPMRLCGSTCVDTTADPDHCGRCDSPCMPLAGSIPFCAASRCVNAVCRPGFGNCDMDRSNGCETDVDTSIEHCGRCGHRCEGAPNAHPVCELGGCTLVCDAGWADCDASTPGCECPL
jgi:hypothetical protein